MSDAANLSLLVDGVLGTEHGLRARQALDLPTLPNAGDGRVSRAELAMALNVVLFDDLLARVPSGAAYVARLRADGWRVIFDHGALRTIDIGQPFSGSLPSGQASFARILAPLGYDVAATYPLPALRMTGRAWRHSDLPEAIPQFFVSELHVDRFSVQFGKVAQAVFGSSRDPLTAEDLALLESVQETGSLPTEEAVRLLPRIAAAFGRMHDLPTEADYEALLAESAEAAWISTEGNAFNHATDRVEDVDTLAHRLRDEGLPMKDRVEHSHSGRVRQTALRADTVERSFVAADGTLVTRRVPGSFYEFISRDIDPATGALDLAFDSGNATGIFAMTKAA